MIFSYTLLNTWTICPHQAARRYIVKDIPFQKTKAMEEGERVHKAMEQRIRAKRPLPQDLDRHELLVKPLDQVHVRAECKLGVTKTGRTTDFFGKDVWLRGVVDAPFLLDQNTAILLDWKTGKPREEPFELEIGALLLQAENPAITKLYGQYVWLQESRRGTLHNLSNTTRTWKQVHALAEDIERAEAVGNFIKTPGPLCNWCPVKSCQHNRNRDA